MRIDRGLLGWGVFLVLAGLVPFAVQQGYVAPSVLAELWRLWPFVLIGIGLGVLLARTPLAWLGGLVVAATFGLLAGAAIGGAIPVACGLGSGIAQGGASATVAGDLQDGATVELSFTCGPLAVKATPGSAWSLTYQHDAGAPPTVEATAARLRVASPTGSFPGIGSNWALALPTLPPLSLDIQANAASADLALQGMQVRDLRGTFNAGSVNLDLSRTTLDTLDLRINAGSGTLSLPAATVHGEVHVNAGSLELCVPAGVGLRITTAGTLSSTDFAGSGLVSSGATWESPDYASASTRIELTVTANAASVTLRRDGGCS